MKKLMVLSVVGLGLSAFAGPIDHVWLKGTTDKEPISYRVGEEITLTVTPMTLDGKALTEKLPEGEYVFNWQRSDDFGKVESGSEPFTGKPFVYKTKLDQPGFFRLQATICDKSGKPYLRKFDGDATTPEGKQAMNQFERASKKIFFDGGAGADLEKLATHPEPKDFDAFWARQFARLDKVPLKAELKQIHPLSNDKVVDAFAVRIDCAGLRPVTGYMTVPKAVKDGKTFPCYLETHGYSGDSCRHNPMGWGYEDRIVLNINAHGLKLAEFGATDADTKALRWEIRSHDLCYAMDAKQNEDPEVAYFNGMVLRVKRALQYLKTVKGWNGKDLVACGGSQGGLQTIWAAACGEGVTRADSCVTWCCDIFTSGKLRLNKSLKLSSDGWYIPWTESMGYYDAANFAKRIPKTCHTNITRAGLGDYCCPPTGLAKLWNNIPGNKEVHWVQGSQHGYVPPAYTGRDTVRRQD